MKITDVSVQGLRGLKSVELDLRDDQGEARPLLLFVGPSGCGKTTLLDAISLAIGPATGFEVRRPDLRFHARDLLHPSTDQAKVEVKVALSGAERTMISAIDGAAAPPDFAHIRWTWPDPQGVHRLGRVESLDGAPLTALASKLRALRLMQDGAPGAGELAARLGRATMFDQNRKLLGDRMSPQLARAIGARIDERDRVTHPRDIAVALWLKAQQSGLGGLRARTQWTAVADAFNRTCAPHQLGGVVLRDDETYDLDIVSDPGVPDSPRYGWEGLSSGERAVFPVLLRAAKENLNHSVILVDEVELHLHPAWQRRFLRALQGIGEDNQLILTSHSEYLRGAVPRSAVIDLGALVEDEAGAPPATADQGAGA